MSDTPHHFARTILHHGFIREEAMVVHTPGEEPRTTKPNSEILFTIVGNEVSESTGAWARVRWEVLCLLDRYGPLETEDLLELLDDDDRKFLNPSVGWHRHYGNVVATRDSDGTIHLAVTPQGHRYARSN